MKQEINNIDNIKLIINAFDEIKKDIKTIKVKVDKNSDKIEKYDKKIDNLDKKINANFSCLKNKIDNETQERKNDISRIEGINDFDRIVLSDFGSRISILEEESEKYAVN